MIKICNKEDSNTIDNYIDSNYEKCLYLYLNYKKYGLVSNDICMYMQYNDEILIALILKYHDCIHIYSKFKDCNYNEICDFISKVKPKVICAESEIIKKLELLLKNDYNSEYGWIRQLKNYSLNNDYQVKQASYKDFMDIAKLLYSDKDISCTYSIDELYKQIADRNIQKYGRNYIIKSGNKIISHGGTGAENDKVAVINYVITDELYRRKGFATKIVKTLCHDLIKESKNVYLINYTNESTALYDKLGFEIVCNWGKLFLKNEVE